MHSYSVAVALFDFVPVLVAAWGLWQLAGAIAVRHRGLALIARIAALLIPFGGLCKAGWKLIVATRGVEIDWLENLLFVSMAPGFVAMAFCLHNARRAWISGATAAAPLAYGRLLLWLAVPLAGALAAALYCPHPRGWFFWLLGITTIANAALLTQAVMACRHGGLRWPIAALAWNFLATLALSGLSRLPPGEATAWIQEGVNLSAQAALAAAFWRLAPRMKQPLKGVA